MHNHYREKLVERSDEAILADICSKDPMRIQLAMVDLKQRMKKSQEIEMAPFGIEIFDPFGGQVPGDTQLNFLTIIRKYRLFVPALSDKEKIAAMIALVLRYADRYVAFELALKIKISPHSIQTVANAMREIVRQGLSSPINVKGAAYLVSRLLDGKSQVRSTVLQLLSQWPDQVPYEEVIEYILPQLEPDEVRVIRKE